MTEIPDHDHLHEDGHSHHDQGKKQLVTMIGSALHLPGFGHHSHAELASDQALQDNNLGIRTVWLALLVLGVTTVLQVLIYVASGSVALLGDTVHNLGDALNSIPLLIALYLVRRAATRRYTYGYGRAEDIAGILIVVSIAFSAAYILAESFHKLINPQPLVNPGWVAAAAIIGFVGNEIVALMQIQVGRQIGSDAMVADGQHARVDGLTSLAVLIAAVGTAIGLPVLDPIIGLLIGTAIVGITWTAMKAMWFRLMDAVDPAYMDIAERIIAEHEEVRSIEKLRLRWIGHRLNGEFVLNVNAGMTLDASKSFVDHITHHLSHALPSIGEITIQINPAARHDPTASQTAGTKPLWPRTS